MSSIVQKMLGLDTAKLQIFINKYPNLFTYISDLGDLDFALFKQTQISCVINPVIYKFQRRNSKLFDEIGGMSIEDHKMFVTLIKNKVWSHDKIKELATAIVSSPQHRHGGRQSYRQGSHKPRGGYKGKNYDPKYHEKKDKKEQQRRQQQHGRQQHGRQQHGYRQSVNVSHRPSPAPSNASPAPSNASSRHPSPFRPVTRPGTAPPHMGGIHGMGWDDYQAN